MRMVSSARRSLRACWSSSWLLRRDRSRLTSSSISNSMALGSRGCSQKGYFQVNGDTRDSARIFQTGVTSIKDAARHFSNRCDIYKDAARHFSNRCDIYKDAARHFSNQYDICKVAKVVHRNRSDVHSNRSDTRPSTQVLAVC